MRVVFVASEMVPFSRSGEMARTVGELAEALSRSGLKVCVILPRLGSMEGATVALSRRLLPLPVRFAGQEFSMDIYEGRLASGVEVKLLGHEEQFAKSCEPVESPDDILRCGLLCHAAMALMAHESDRVDILHAHGWQAALVPHLLRHGDVRPENLSSTSSVLTIHDLRHQGIADAGMVERLGLSRKHFVPQGFEYFGQLNILKAGLVTADRVTTVSASYAREMMEPSGGVGLEGVLRSLSGGIRGILNGIDTDLWNPDTDDRIEVNYSAEDPAGKALCKEALQKNLGMPVRPDVPLIGMASHLDAARGADLFLTIASRLLRSDVQLVVMGDGDEELVDGWSRLAGRYPDKVAFRREADENSTAAVFAGSDILAIPSRFAPGGGTQAIAMRYGAVPVVHGTGGLADSVIDVDRNLETGTGFAFGSQDAVDLLGALLRAVLACAYRREWKQLVARIMRVDVSWKRSARKYAALYEELREDVGGPL